MSEVEMGDFDRLWRVANRAKQSDVSGGAAMSAYRSDGASKNAYIQRTLKAERHDGTVFGVGKLLCDSGGIGADLFRHAMLLIGVVGLVGIAAGALTGCPLYENTLNWVTSLFCR